MGDFGGAFAGAGVQAAGMVSAQRKNIKASRHARQWQEMMASTAYQRTVKDLQAAGLNPALAFGHVNTASTPSTQVPQFENIAGGMGETLMSAAKQAKQIGEQTKLLRAQREEKHHQASTAAYESITAESIARNSGANADAAVREREAHAAALEKQAQQSGALTTGIKYDNALKQADAEFYSTDFGQKMRAFERAVDSVSGLGRFGVSVGPRKDNRPTYEHTEETFGEGHRTRSTTRGRFKR